MNNFIEQIVEKSIVIAPQSLIPNLIKIKNKQINIVDIKMMTIEEFLQNYCFSYTEKTIVYLMKKYQLKYPLAKLYLKHMYIIDNVKNDIPNLKWLREIMEDLKEQHLLISNPFFVQGLSSTKIYIYRYPHLSKFYFDLLKPLNPVYIEDVENDYHHQVLEFATLEDELEAVARDIIDHFYEGIPWNKIKIVNSSNEFKNQIERIMKNYHIPLKVKQNSIYATPIVQTFLNELQDPIDETLSLLKNKYNLKKEQNAKIYQKIIELLNKYVFATSYLDVKQCLIEELKNIKIENNESEVVEMIDIDEIVADDNYYYLFGINQGEFPALKKDDDFISDKLKKEIGLETAEQFNKISVEVAIKKIRSYQNMWLSYHKFDGKKECDLASICKDLSFPILKKEELSLVRYSSKLDRLRLAKEYDNWLKYGTYNEYLPYLSQHLKIPYRDYLNDFTPISNSLLKQKIETLTLSYTALNNYYKCPFKYYCSNILNLDQYETTFDAFVGSVFHNVLSKAFAKENNLDVTTLYQQAITEERKRLQNQKCPFSLTKENETFLQFLKEDIQFVVTTITKQLKNSKLMDALFEKKITVTKEKDVTVVFKGFIDKILLLKEGDTNYLAIIDYKTGKEEIELKKVKFGLNLQLPIYLYLASFLEEWDNKTEVTGFYLQKILNKEQNKVPGITYEQLKIDSLKLEGYSNTNVDVLEKLDSNYQNSTLIKGMRVKNDGSFYSNVKSLSSDKMKALTNYVDKLIDEASDNIIAGNFSIAPKQIGDKIVSCDFCPFSELCYRKEKDIVHLKLPENLDFLGGVDDE